MSEQSRRSFLQQSMMATASAFAMSQASLATRPTFAQASSGDKLRCAVIGAGGRGSHISAMLDRKDVVITHICDVDEQQGGRRCEAIGKAQARLQHSYLTFASCSTTSRSTSSPSQRQTTGTRWLRSTRCKLVKMCTLKSQSAITLSKDVDWFKWLASTTRLCRPVLSVDPIPVCVMPWHSFMAVALVM